MPLYTRKSHLVREEKGRNFVLSYFLSSFFWYILAPNPKGNKSDGSPRTAAAAEGAAKIEGISLKDKLLNDQRRRRPLEREAKEEDHARLCQN